MGNNIGKVCLYSVGTTTTLSTTQSYMSDHRTHFPTVTTPPLSDQFPAPP
ncbi:hypothetical protein SESBI_36502 [Sesbania bispinosa]|nr:hypothetical protein SESBI_36502 [Sesbania bispinosa]